MTLLQSVHAPIWQLVLDILLLKLKFNRRETQEVKHFIALQPRGAMKEGMEIF